MKRMYLSISKGDSLRFLGHLDFLRTMERAILRAGIPVAFSEGFNPHMKVAFDTALSVGVAADPFYMDIRLEDDTWTPADVAEHLRPQLLKGIVIHEVVEADPSWPKLVTWLNEDAYEMEGPVLDGADAEAAREAVERFNALDSFIYTRVTPKKTREMDVKPMILEPLAVRIEKNRAYLRFSLIRSNSGTVQPKDIWKMMAESFGLPWTPGEFICSRTGTWHRENGQRLNPLDPGVFDVGEGKGV
jgi:radical SAM-linked protein